MAYPSTFSIVAYDPGDDAWGIAVASKFLAAGAVVPWARSGAGAIATQSYANTSYGPRGLALMELGLSAQHTLETLLAQDPEAETRQVGIVDRQGNATTFTGNKCHAWAGGLTGDNFAVQGNILAGTNVIAAMAASFESTSSQGLAQRLQTALLAGDRAGGDRRGRQSAAILVVKSNAGYGGFNDRLVDYRVDDHPDPVVRMGELLELHDLYFEKSPASDQIHLAGEPLQRLQKIMAQLGYYEGDLDGIYGDETRQAVEAFMGNENFEERIDIASGKIDLPVINYIYTHFGG